MARGTRLFQAPRSPLIQGQSRLRRPWWQPYGVAMVIGFSWPLVTFTASALIGNPEDPVSQIAAKSGAAWLGSLPLLVPTVLLGGAVGIAAGALWGARRLWLAATIGALACWYLVRALVAIVD